jgi:hypothetical protein
MPVAEVMAGWPGGGGCQTWEGIVKSGCKTPALGLLVLFTGL